MLQESKFKYLYSLLYSNKLIVWVFKACLFGGIFLFFLTLTYLVTHPSLPSQKKPLLFYSNQTSNDLKILFKEAISTAQKSLFLQIYGCTDPHLIQEIQKTSEKIPVTLLYDPSGSGSLNKKLPCAIPLSSQGLMHKKILIVDEEKVFIGSANFTPTSLRMHDNLVVGLYHKELASFIKHSTRNHFFFSVGDQEGEFWHLPDFQHECLNRILKAIEESSCSIHAALFTFTHPVLIEALIRARERGVQIHLALDFYSSQGSSRKTVDLLKKQAIFPLISQGGKLLHYKWALIDGSTLFLGSTNWTKMAFNKNEDCIFVLKHLTFKQKNYFLTLWEEIKRNSLQ